MHSHHRTGYEELIKSCVFVPRRFRSWPFNIYLLTYRRKIVSTLVTPPPCNRPHNGSSRRVSIVVTVLQRVGRAEELDTDGWRHQLRERERERVSGLWWRHKPSTSNHNNKNNNNIIFVTNIYILFSSSSIFFVSSLATNVTFPVNYVISSGCLKYV